MAEAIAQQIRQLEEARKHVLADAHHYSAIIPGILPIIGPNAQLAIRRWGADFLAEGFASPALAASKKEELSIKVLPLLRELVESPTQDTEVAKSVILIAASVYGLILRYMIRNPQDVTPWSYLSAIKLNILKRWDTEPVDVRVCCIKFVQRVVQAQTLGVAADPRRPDPNDISLAIVPREHPIIHASHLEAEASGLLDRLLNIFYEETSNALLIDATLNCLSPLVRARPSISNRIVSVLLGFNPFKDAAKMASLRERVLLKSVEKTTRAFMLNLYRRNENGPLAGRIKQYLDRLLAARLEMNDEASRKRGPSDPLDGARDARRVRLDTDSGQLNVPPLPSGPVSVAQLYTLTNDEALKAFDTTSIPGELVVKITLAVLQHVESRQLDEAINAVRSRFLEVSRRAPPPQVLPPTANNDDDDYEPEFEPEEDAEQMQNRDDNDASIAFPVPELTLGPFTLAQPPPLTFDEAESMEQSSIGRVFTLMSEVDEPSRAFGAGIQRLAGSRFDRETWLTTLIRLATRPYPVTTPPKGLQGNAAIALAKARTRGSGDAIREMLWRYVRDDFRHRIDIAIAWLNEEWYNDRMVQHTYEKAASSQTEPARVPAHYEKWVLKLLDAITPYLDANDKILVRFVAEIPEISIAVMDRVKNMAKDPDRVTLTVKTIYYLYAFKPPCRELAADALEDLWRNYDAARASAKPYLAKARPALFVKPESDNPEASAIEPPSSKAAPSDSTLPSASASSSAPNQPSVNNTAPPANAVAAAG